MTNNVYPDQTGDGGGFIILRLIRRRRMSFFLFAAVVMDICQREVILFVLLDNQDTVF
jgi:hypothetical protein